MVYVAETTIDARTRAGRDETAELERLGDEIAELAAQLHAAAYRLLVMLREFDERGGWSGGFRSCAHWLSWRTGIGLGAAREKVRVARALQQLPRLSEAMRRGELSFAKVRACSRVATPANEEQLLELARQGTASHLERIVRAWRRVDRLEEQFHERERHRKRELTLYVDDDGMYVLRGRLNPEVGAVLERALSAASEALYGRRSAEEERARLRGADGIEAATVGQRRADAIGLMVECALRDELEVAAPVTWRACGRGVRRAAHPNSRGRADRFQVVVHVEAEVLRESADSGESVLDGTRISAETSRRLACDASRVVMVHNAQGETIAVGGRTRTVSPAIRRALEHRDRGCRFPGCGMRFCDVHHVKHWADGGASTLENTVLTCRVHHRALHEEALGSGSRRTANSGSTGPMAGCSRTYPRHQARRRMYQRVWRPYIARSVSRSTRRPQCPAGGASVSIWTMRSAPSVVPTCEAKFRDPDGWRGSRSTCARSRPGLSMVSFLPVASRVRCSTRYVERSRIETGCPVLRHSPRRIANGSTALARRAGMHAASSAPPPTSSTIATKVTGFGRVDVVEHAAQEGCQAKGHDEAAADAGQREHGAVPAGKE